MDRLDAMEERMAHLIRTVDDLTEAYNWACSSPEAAQFDTIYIDSISEIGEVVLSNAKAQVKDPRQAYGELIEKMMVTLKAFRDLPGKLEHGDLAVREEGPDGRLLPTAIFARWSND